MVRRIGYSQCYADVHRHLRAVRKATAAAPHQAGLVAGGTCAPCRYGRQLSQRSGEREEGAVLTENERVGAGVGSDVGEADAGALIEAVRRCRIAIRSKPATK